MCPGGIRPARVLVVRATRGAGSDIYAVNFTPGWWEGEGGGSPAHKGIKVS